VRCDQRHKLNPRHDLFQLIEQDLLARASVAEIKAKVFLFRVVIDRNLCAAVKSIGGEF
jgi:hypothetical protein